LQQRQRIVFKVLQFKAIDFRTGIVCRKVFSNEFKVDKYFRFEGESNPSDAAILYAISSNQDGLKGVLVNAYGIYSEPLTDEMMEKFKI